MKIFAKNCLVDGFFTPAIVTISGQHIQSVEKREPNQNEELSHRFDDGFLIPGLIDLQINGGFGFDFSTCTSAEAKQVFRGLARNGTTSICPTVITSDRSFLANQISNLSHLEPEIGLARNLGVHLEGPAISKMKKGAHDEGHLISAKELLNSKINLADLKILTLAPELPDADALVAAAVAAGAIVSMGHSEATYKKAKEAKAWGASMVTHLFNGMNAIHQREPGLIIATLLDEELHFGLIVDGAHVDYELVRLSQILAGERMIVVSDASAALQSKPGAQFELGGMAVVVDDSGNARREDGTLASSGLTQLQAIERAVQYGLSRTALLKSATTTPADFIGEKKLGRISAGAFADLIQYTVGEELSINLAMVGGELCQ